MPDLSSIGAALSSVKTATEIVEYFRSSELSLKEAEAKLKLADLIAALADVKISLADAQQLIADRDAVIRELEGKIRLGANMHWDGTKYWKHDNDLTDGPFCPACFDKDGKPIRLQDFGEGHWYCAVCKDNFHDRAPSGVVVEII